MRSLPDAILVPTWLHFGSQNPPKSRLGGLLDRLRRVLKRLGRILERLGGVLERPGRVLERLGTELGASWEVSSAPRAIRATRGLRFGQVRSSSTPRGQTTSNEEGNLQRDYKTSTDHLTTDADTQLGAFGPGADPMRSRAAYPPPRLAVNFFIF